MAAWSTFLISVNFAMVAMNVLCTPSNMMDSCGSCFRISSEPMKMFSRYIQFRCTCWHISIISDMSDRDCSQYVICSWNTRKYLEAFIVDSVTVLSSRARNASSVLRSL